MKLPIKYQNAKIVHTGTDTVFEVVIGSCYGAEWLEEVAGMRCSDQELENRFAGMSEDELFRIVESLFINAKETNADSASRVFIASDPLV